MKRIVRISRRGLVAFLILTFAAIGSSEAGSPHVLYVENPTSSWIDVHCDGEWLGGVAPGERRELFPQSDLLREGRKNVVLLQAFQYDAEKRSLLEELELTLDSSRELNWAPSR